jgi:hypothetical protein
MVVPFIRANTRATISIIPRKAKEKSKIKGQKAMTNAKGQMPNQVQNPNALNR